MLPQLQLDAAALDRLFPCHLVLDSQARIIEAGRVVRRLLPELSAAPLLQDAFRIERPQGVGDFSSLCRARDQAFLLSAHSRGTVRLKGEFFPLEDGSRGVFFTVLWFSEASALDALGLTIDDFALSDTSSDLLFLVETQAALLRDAQLLSERLRMARDEALAASRHKSEFLANMSHELRTPLNAIIGFSDYLLTASSSAAGPKQGEYLSDIKSSGQYLLDMVNDLLDLARIEQGKLVLDEETVDFGAAVRDAVRAVTEAARKRSLLIRLGGFDRPFAVRADRRMIRQILLNLLSNAVKFNKDSGTITLSAGETIAGDLSIAIEDTGIGVDPKAIPDLFEPFRQADSQVARTYGGTGLGLAIVRQLVRLHGGDVTMQSTPGIGTTISFNLPAQRILRGHALPQSCSVGDRNRSLTA